MELMAPGKISIANLRAINFFKLDGVDGVDGSKVFLNSFANFPNLKKFKNWTFLVDRSFFFLFQKGIFNLQMDIYCLGTDFEKVENLKLILKPKMFLHERRSH